MKTNRKNRKVEAEFRRLEIMSFILRLDKKIEKIINYFVTQIEKTYQN